MQFQHPDAGENRQRVDEHQHGKAAKVFFASVADEREDGLDAEQDRSEERNEVELTFDLDRVENVDRQAHMNRAEQMSDDQTNETMANDRRGLHTCVRARQSSAHMDDKDHECMGYV